MDIVGLVFALIALAVAVSFWVWSLRELKPSRDMYGFGRLEAKLDDHETRISRLEGAQQ